MAVEKLKPSQSPVTRRTFCGVLVGLAALLIGCSKPSVPTGFERVMIDGRAFTLELVADDESRTLGLGGRESIPEDGGMLFSFPRARVLSFIMRDCLVSIDLIFLDGTGTITAMHHMPVEDPIRPDETRTVGRNAGTYELRLKRYSSRFNAQYAIELRGGSLETLNLQVGDKINLDTERLQALTR